MRDTNLVNALREHAEWARVNEWETPITLGDDLVNAADRIANQSTHIAALQKEIERLRDGRRWVPAEERLPEQMEWVLCACIDGRIRVLRYDHITDDYDFAVVDGHGYCISAASVTHWMPLPELPEEEK